MDYFCYEKLAPEPVLCQWDQLPPIGARARVIYFRLFKYVQQHTAGVIEKKWTLHLLGPALNGTISSPLWYRSVPFSKCETFIYDWPCIANRCIDDWSEGIITQTSNEVLLIFPVYVIIGLVRIEIHLYSICLYIYVKFGHNNFPMVINSSNGFP